MDVRDRKNENMKCCLLMMTVLMVGVANTGCRIIGGGVAGGVTFAPNNRASTPIDANEEMRGAKRAINGGAGLPRNKTRGRKLMCKDSRSFAAILGFWIGQANPERLEPPISDFLLSR